MLPRLILKSNKNIILENDKKLKCNKMSNIEENIVNN